MAGLTIVDPTFSLRSVDSSIKHWTRELAGAARACFEKAFVAASAAESESNAEALVKIYLEFLYSIMNIVDLVAFCLELTDPAGGIAATKYSLPTSIVTKIYPGGYRDNERGQIPFLWREVGGLQLRAIIDARNTTAHRENLAVDFVHGAGRALYLRCRKLNEAAGVPLDRPLMRTVLELFAKVVSGIRTFREASALGHIPSVV